MIFFFLQQGYADASRVASKADQAYDLNPLPETMNEDEEESEESESEIILKYLRVFPEYDDEKYAIFCEYGFNRNYTAKLVEDNEIELRLHMNIPPDNLLSENGFHAVKASVKLDEMNEDFYFDAPEGRRFALVQGEESKLPHYFPNKIFPEWVVFTFKLEPQRVEVEVKADVNVLENIKNMQQQLKEKST